MPGDLSPMVQSLMAEISEHLLALAERDVRAAIDLKSLPMQPEARDELDAFLGKGEVAAMVEAGGVTEIWETGYAGVWRVRHMGAGGRIAAERIEITAIPDILAGDAADIAAAAQRLGRDIGRHGAATAKAEERQNA